MEIVALAGGIGAGKFLRGLDRVARAQGHAVTVIVNTADDVEVHGLHVSPDLDSVCYWLAGLMDRERGWGRADETFEVLGELRRAGVDTWFALGDRDLAVHLRRTELLASGATLGEATASLNRERFHLPVSVMPMTDDPVTTRIEVVDPAGHALDLHFQEYWVQRRATDPVKGITYRGAERARPTPRAVEAIDAADAILICPSNPVASIAPILAVPGYRRALEQACTRVAGISPIVGGSPLAGMADRLMPAAGLEVSAVGAGRPLVGLADGWVIDERDRELAPRVREELGMRVAITDTVMTDDARAASLARTALDLVKGTG